MHERPLPEVMGRDVAFLDRIHGFLPGWCAPQVSESRLARGVGFMADYLSEIMHQMRSRNYGHILLDHVDFNGMGKRSETAITKIASGLLKLVYPHRTLATVQRERWKEVPRAAERWAWGGPKNAGWIGSA